MNYCMISKAKKPMHVVLEQINTNTDHKNHHCNRLFFYVAPRPECTTDPECSDHLACIREKCLNPCSTSTCGVNAECRVTLHRALCVCRPGFEGDPYRICEERKLHTLKGSLKSQILIGIDFSNP